ncbi:PAS domain S-box-containing protein [Desulfotomaculum arcticum]|uniref:PAS domain S-box-containing protein n=1 Tax=Desulfotruncus arcticus DSM 17038 TaxID=1121424 RepID=A0A1I2P9Z0_9FIRM|nr:sigma 54-interacting transcriptional regulator [Desulfotruncus arcticus]SFG12323.1 PAS domain S-box-containing protein [Desulfotomaculum arcticum] [Desulfotruncus arcticus DSM 17038]
MKTLLAKADNSTRVWLSQILRDAGRHVIECDNGTNEPNFAIAMVKNIKEPKKAKMVLNWYKLFFEHARDIILFIRREDGGIVEANNSAVNAYGYSRDELLAMSIYDLRAKETLPLVKAQMEQANHQGILFETIHQRKDGGTLHVEVGSQGVTIGNERILLSVIRDITARKKTVDNLRAANKEPADSRGAPKKVLPQGKGPGGIVIFSKKMESLFQQAKKYHTDRSIPVLIQGETGTGKEVIAKYIHYGGLSVVEPFIDVNCAALTSSLFESELFGYESGAFTGGLPRGQKGKLDLASGGTIFFDEITELPIALQAKLLRVIQEKEFYRVGGLRKIRIDIRIICATNGNIEKKVKEGLFRQDLYYRLNVGRLLLLPLRERKEEILPLATKFLEDFSHQRGKRFSKISDSAAKLLLFYSWPGNVRELRNTIEWVTFMYDDSVLKPAHLEILRQNENVRVAEDCAPVMDPDNFTLPAEGLYLEKFLNNIVGQALAMHNGNKTKAARYLGISRRSLQCRVDRMRRQLSGD